MLRAKVQSGDDVVARRDLPREETYRCLSCRDVVTFKPGRSVTPHFAHRTGSGCTAAGESQRHMEAKLFLARRFAEQGYGVVVEETHPDAGRRVDVAVTVPSGHRIAVEVQDSKIDVNTMKSRMKIDQRLGFFATLWVFTSNRLPDVVRGGPDPECRVPDELRWITNRTGQPVWLLDTDTGCLFGISLQEVVRFSDSSYPDITLKTIKALDVRAAHFALSAVRGRYATPSAPDWTVVFEAVPSLSDAPWTVFWWLQPSSPEDVQVQHFKAAPDWLDRRTALVARGRQLRASVIQLQHNASGRLWVMKVSTASGREVSRLGSTARRTPT